MAQPVGLSPINIFVYDTSGELFIGGFSGGCCVVVALVAVVVALFVARLLVGSFRCW